MYVTVLFQPLLQRNNNIHKMYKRKFHTLLEILKNFLPVNYFYLKEESYFAIF